MAIKTLNEIAHLKNSECGKPYPRHGLQLLYWFACDYVNFEDDRPFLEYDPSDGDFGFKPFHNNEDLLPDQDNPYYEVGNLNSNGASELPEYVQENYDNEQDKTNTNSDRIIICLDDNSEFLHKIYVTRHDGQWNFDENHTYRISKGLLKIISNFPDSYTFLKAVGYVKKQRPDSNNVTRDLRITIPEATDTLWPPNHSVSVTSHVCVQRPAESLNITIPEETPPTSTKRSHPPQRWNICKCTIL